jgi:hypothetical protein
MNMELDMTRALGVIVFWMVLSIGPMLAHDGHTHKIMGTVTARDDKHLEVKTPSGENLSIQINDKTLVTRAKRKIVLDEVKIGRRVVVDIGNGEDPLIAREIQVGATKIVDEPAQDKATNTKPASTTKPANPVK